MSRDDWLDARWTGSRRGHRFRPAAWHLLPGASCPASPAERLLPSASYSDIDSSVRPFVSRTNRMTKKIATKAKKVYTP